MTAQKKCNRLDMVLVEKSIGNYVERLIVEIVPYAGENGGFGEKFFYKLDRPLTLFGSRWVADYAIKAVVVG